MGIFFAPLGCGKNPPKKCKLIIFSNRKYVLGVFFAPLGCGKNPPKKYLPDTFFRKKYVPGIFSRCAASTTGIPAPNIKNVSAFGDDEKNIHFFIQSRQL